MLSFVSSLHTTASPLHTLMYISVHYHVILLCHPCILLLHPCIPSCISLSTIMFLAYYCFTLAYLHVYLCPLSCYTPCILLLHPRVYLSYMYILVSSLHTTALPLHTLMYISVHYHVILLCHPCPPPPLPQCQPQRSTSSSLCWTSCVRFWS